MQSYWLDCVRVNVEVRLGISITACTIVQQTQRGEYYYLTSNDDNMYYISYTRMNTTPSPRGKTALVASFACACVRFCWFRFVLFSSLGAAVFIRSTIAKEKWNKYTQISWIWGGINSSWELLSDGSSWGARCWRVYEFHRWNWLVGVSSWDPLYAMMVQATGLCVVSWFLNYRTYRRVVKIVQGCGFIVYRLQLLEMLFW